jgi:hypothetical protein
MVDAAAGIENERLIRTEARHKARRMVRLVAAAIPRRRGRCLLFGYRHAHSGG